MDIWLVLLGGALSIVGGVIASWLAAKRDREARAGERRERRREIRDAELREISDLAAELLEGRVRRVAPGPPPGTEMQDLAWRNVRCLMRIKALVARLGDEPLREAVDAFSGTLGDFFVSTSVEEGDAERLREAYNSVTARVVTLLNESG